MKTKLCLLFAFAALVAASCTREANPVKEDEKQNGNQEEQTTPGYQDPENPNVYVGGTPITFTAMMDDGESLKSTISGNVVSWESGDAISVLWNGGRTVATTTDSGANATFSTSVDAEAAGGVYYSVCPAAVSCDLASTDVINVTIPATQDGTFTSANINVAKTTATSFAFKAVGNLISFTITDANVTKVKIYSWDQTPLAGTVPVTVSGETPSLGTATDTSSEIEVAVNGAGTYYAVVLPGTHADGLLFAPETASEGKPAAWAEKNFTFVRKGNTQFGDIASHARELYVSASGSGKGLTEATAMSPSTFATLLSQPMDAGDNQDDALAIRYYSLLNHNTVNVLDDITIDPIKMEYSGSIPRALILTIKGASSTTAITPIGTDRMFRVGNNITVTFEDITLSGARLDSGNGGAILIQNGSLSTARVYCNNVTFDDNQVASGNGGAVSINAYSKAASFTADGCTFSNNTASANGGAFYQSASADGNAANSTSTFTNCTITQNSAAKGGFAQVYRGTANFGEGSVFTKNTATEDGGVFYVNGAADMSKLIVTGCTFGGASYSDANEAAGTTNAGGVLYKEGGDVSFTGSTFTYNSASAKNGGVATIKNNTGTAVFTECTLSYNKAAANGGVLYLTNNGVATLVNCKADHNTAPNAGGFAQIYKGTLNIDNDGSDTGKHSDFRQNSSTDGGCIYLNNAGATLNVGQNTTEGLIVFFQNSASYGGAIEMESGAGTFNVSKAKFSGNAATVCAGAIGAYKGTFNISDSQFLDNVADDSGAKSVSDTSNDGKGGAIIASGGDVVVNLTNSYFYNNRAGKKDNTDSKNYGGAILIMNGIVNCTNCKFEGNKGNRGSCVMILKDSGGIFKADKCAFYDNKTYSRGLIYMPGKGVAYLNRCSFYNNKLRGTSSAWGVIAHGASTSAICMNNCSVNCPNNSYSSNIAAINTDGSLLLTENTLIGQLPTAVVRTGATGGYLSSVGNVIVNTTGSNNSYNVQSTTGFYEGYNLLGANNNMNSTPGISASSKTGVDASAFTWTAYSNPAEGTPGTDSLWENWYTWAGPTSLSFTAPSQSDVTAAYSNFALDASSWGNSCSSITNVGTDFKAWLDSLSPVGYTVNQRGTARTGSFWPGSYQN